MLKSSEKLQHVLLKTSASFIEILYKNKKRRASFFYDPSMSFKSFSIMLLTSRLYYCQQQEALLHQLFFASNF